jgi:DNA-binding NtrC family response regulator
VERQNAYADQTPSLDNLTIDLEQEPDTAVGAAWVRFENAYESHKIRLEPGDRVVVGSSLDVDVRLTDRAVSARHAAIVHCGDGIEVVDFGSRNGVCAGGARIERAWLRTGGSVELGRTTVFVEVVQDHREKPAASLLPGLVGTSDPMRRLAASVRRFAALKLPAMVRGESGSGKELVARAMHKESRRAEGPFVALNAATISRELAESELFGHVKGAFTGAFRDRRGAFRTAHKGTLFLDEIGSLPLDLQAKLLRVVEEGLIWPVGAETSSNVDVRLVVATCEPLELMIKARRFRADLYERLAVCSLQVPPLRERPSDIEALCTHLLVSSGLEKHFVSQSALAELRTYRWPGNVRELRNVIVQAAMRAPGKIIEVGHVSRVIAERTGAGSSRFNRDELVKIWEDSRKNISEAARRVNLPRTTMRDLLRAAGIGGN